MNSMDKEEFSRIRELYGEEDVIPAHSFDNHVLEVYRNAKKLLEDEDVDSEVVKYSALLHDVGRHISGEESHAEKGAEKANEFLIEQLGKDSSFAERVSECIRFHSNRPHLKPPTREAEILWTADKMDAMGATGLCRFLLTLGAKNYSCESAVDILDRRVSEAEESLKDFGFDELIDGLNTLKSFTEQYKEENHVSN